MLKSVSTLAGDASEVVLEGREVLRSKLVRQFVRARSMRANRANVTKRAEQRTDRRDKALEVTLVAE